MIKQSVKRRRGDDDVSATTMDKLSQLPQPILHHVLSLLSQKDAVRTCVLSKSWRYLWHGRFNLEFRDKWFAKEKVFWPFFDKTLQSYHDQSLSLRQLTVDIRRFGVDNFVLLQKWIPMVVMNMCVRSLNLIYDFSFSPRAFPHPMPIFQSEFLVELRLQGRSLNTLKSTDNVRLKNLRTLRLHYVHIQDEIFEKIISGCPLIERLDLIGCFDLKSIKLRKHHNIKHFGCLVNDKVVVEIENPHTLESFHIENDRNNWFFPHKNMHFSHLKSLNLYRVQLLAETFDYFSSFFPCLCELMLDSCHGLKEFVLSSSSIKRLTIKIDPTIYPGKRIKAFIDTPNILYFEYSDDGFLPSIKFTTTFNKWNSHISVSYKPKPLGNDAASWLLKLNELLKALSESHITLDLVHNKFRKLRISDYNICLYEIVAVKHFKLLGYFSSFSIRAILNCLFRICRPRYIHMDHNASEHAEYICNLISNEIGCYFWLQDLEEVNIEVMDTKAIEWVCVQRSSLPEMPSKQLVRFQMTWREQLSTFT